MSNINFFLVGNVAARVRMQGSIFVAELQSDKKLRTNYFKRRDLMETKVRVRTLNNFCNSCIRSHFNKLNRNDDGLVFIFYLK